MPRVGDQHFPYTEAGYAAAAKAKKVKGYNLGGNVGMSNPFERLGGYTPEQMDNARWLVRMGFKPDLLSALGDTSNLPSDEAPAPAPASASAPASAPALSGGASAGGFDASGLLSRLAALEGAGEFDASGLQGRLSALEGVGGFDDSGLQRRLAELEGRRAPRGFDDSGLQGRLAALESAGGFDASGLQGRLAELEGRSAPQEFDASGLLSRLAALEGAGGFDASGLQGRLAALEGRETFDASGLQERLRQLEGAGGFDDSGLQDRLSALEGAGGDDVRSAPPIVGGLFGRQYVDDPELNTLYNQLQMTIQMGGGFIKETPEEAAASSQAQRQLEQQIIAAGGKPYQYFTELPHGGFTEERGPRPGYDPMTGTYPENFTNPPKPEELLNKIDGVRTQSNWGTPEQMDNANWMVKMGLAPDLATAKAEVLKTAGISSAPPPPPTPPSSVTPGRNEELKGLSNEDWLKKMFPGTPPPPTPINEMSYSTISDQPYANSSSSNMADYENSQPLPPPPPPATADMTTMQNPYVFGGYGAPPSMPYAGMATPQIPSIMGMAPPSYYGGSAEPVGMADPTQRVS